MRHPGGLSARDPLALRIHLLGQIDLATCYGLQERLVYEAGEPDGAALTVLLCEHDPVITVGRSGSRAHVRVSRHELTARQIELVWVNRGGGCIYHAPGQLAVYPIVSLPRVGWSVGELMGRMAWAVRQALERIGVAAWSPPGQFGCWGRSGLLAACGVAVHYEVSCHGFFINVHPPMDLTRRIDTVYRPPDIPDARRTMSSLLSERGRPLRMPQVRSAVVEALGSALSRPRFHLQNGHIYLAALAARRGKTARAS